MKNKILVLISLIFLFVAGILAPLAFGFGKTGKGTTVLGRDYSLLNKKEIGEKLTRDFPMEGELKLIEGERKFSIDLASISATVDKDQLSSKLLFRRLKQGVGRYIRAFFEVKDFQLIVNWNEEKINQIVEEIASQIDKPFIPSEIILEKGMSVKEGQAGRQINREKLVELIYEKLTNYKINEELNIPVEIIGKLPDDEEKKEALKRATLFLGKTVKFVDGEVESEVNDEILISWIGFGQSYQEQKINDYVENLEKSLKKEAQNAEFAFENGKVLEFKPAKDGYSVNSEELKSEIKMDFSNWEKEKEKIIIAKLPLIKSEAQIKNEEVNDLGIKELLGRGSSTFKHSSETRNWNVEKGASIVNRILVAPGETFSFIKNLGEVSLENGYKKAYIIRQGKTELDVGGGICQVSTTLFRAMLDAGLDITQRQAHAYRVSYYEEDTKPGFDATVFIPNPDLKFVNDTGNYVLIQSYYDGKNKKLTYEIYGTSDGRKAIVDNYKQWGAAPAPPDVWIDDPTLPAGKVIKDESRVPGLKTAFDWTVTKNGEIIHQKTFTSSYTPWAAVYRRGTGI